MSFKVHISGIPQTKTFFNLKSKSIQAQIQKGLTNAAIFLQGEVKSSIAGKRSEHMSVDTGRFLNSVGINVGKVDAVIYSGLPYADFLEFGTSTFSGRRHFTNSKARNKGKIIQILQSSVNKA